jgi:glycosyltransferase involved in cell wall biosynthesis
MRENKIALTLKILLLSNCPLVESQGSGYVILNTAKSLSNLGHEVEIIPPSSFLILPFLSSRAKNYRLALGMAYWVYRNIKKLRSQDLIIFYGAESSLAVLLLKRIHRLNVPLMLHSNGLESHVDFRLNHFQNYIGSKKKWYHLNLSILYNYCYRNIDYILMVSKYDRDYALKYLKISQNKLFYIEPGLPEEFIKMNSVQVYEKSNIIAFCGSWVDRKGTEGIKAAVPKILSKFPEYQFRLIGVGKQFKKEENFPKAVLPQIDVIPFVNKKEEMVQLYNTSSIFLFPSFCESFGLVIAEAMCCNCAVITGPTGFAYSLIDEVEALVLEIPDENSIYLALEKLILNTNLRITLSKNGRERIEKLKWSNYEKELENLLVVISSN